MYPHSVMWIHSSGLAGQRWVPWQEFVDPADWVVGDAFEGVLEVDLWIESVELGRAEQRVDGCCAFTTGVRTGEEKVFTSEGDDAQRPLGGVVVDLELFIVDVTGEGTPAREAVADRSRGVRLAGEPRKRGFEPRVHAIEKSFCSGLTDRLPDLRRAAPYLLFDGIESGDALDRFGCSR